MSVGYGKIITFRDSFILMISGETVKKKFARFMVGRNGNDDLNRFLLLCDVVLLLMGTVFSRSIGRICYPLVLILLVLIYIRMFSRNIYKRADENNKYIRQKVKVLSWFRLRKEQWTQRKEYKFFKCPACKSTLRVPRSGGKKIKIVCRKCGHSFIGKS